jgi:hypothetical protein
MTPTGHRCSSACLDPGAWINTYEQALYFFMTYVASCRDGVPGDR